MYKHTIRRIQELYDSECSDRFEIRSTDALIPSCSDDYAEISGDGIYILKCRLGFKRTVPNDELIGVTINSNSKSFEETIRNLVKDPPVIPRTIFDINKEILRAIRSHSSPNFPEDDEATVLYFTTYSSLVDDEGPEIIDKGWIEHMNRMVGNNRITENKTPTIKIKSRGLYFTYTEGEKISEYVLCYSHNIIEKLS